MKKMLRLTAFCAAALCSPVVHGSDMEDAAGIEVAAQQPERPKHPARVVQAEAKKEAPELPTELSALVEKVESLNESAFEELLSVCADKSDWPDSVVMRCLVIAAGAGYVPAQAELFKRCENSENQIAVYWLSEVAYCKDVKALKEVAAWLQQNSQNWSARDFAGKMESRATLLESDSDSVQNPVLSIENEYPSGFYPSLKPGSEAACALETGAKMQPPASQSTTVPAAERHGQTTPLHAAVEDDERPPYRDGAWGAYSKYCEARDGMDRTPLMLAVIRKRLRWVLFLVEAGADVNAASVQYGTTVLMMAAMNGHADVLPYLLKAGARINDANKSGYTALMLAARAGHTEVVESLLEAGANKYLKDGSGQNAADHAKTPQLKAMLR